MSKHKAIIDCSIAITWCNDCQSIHIALINEHSEMIGVGDIPDIDIMVEMLRTAKILGERPQRLQ